MLKKIFLFTAFMFLSACMQTQVKFSDNIPPKPTYSKFYNYRGNKINPIEICGYADNVAMVEETENFPSAVIRVLLMDLWQPTFVNVYCKNQQYRNNNSYYIR